MAKWRDVARSDGLDDETFTCTTARRNSLGETHIAQRKLNRTGGAAENEDAVDTITGFDFAV